MQTHRLQLAVVPFDAIASGSKTIESRLYDKKRQTIQLGDIIIFTNREDTDQTVTAEVIGLLRYATFRDLFSRNTPTKFGGESAAWPELRRARSCIPLYATTPIAANIAISGFLHVFYDSTPSLLAGKGISD